MCERDPDEIDCASSDKTPVPFAREVVYSGRCSRGVDPLLPVCVVSPYSMGLIHHMVRHDEVNSCPSCVQ